MLAEFNTHPFSNVEETVLEYVTYVGASVSLVAGVFIIYSYVAYTGLRNFPYKLIVYMSISDILSSISYLLGINSDLCQEQAIISQFFTLATFFWTACFGFNIFVVLVLNRSHVETYELSYHLICWGLAGSLLAINIALQSFGEVVVWCWITQEHEVLRLTTFYLPLIFVFIFNAVCYSMIKRALRGDLREKDVSRRLTQYLLAFFFIRVWSVVNRLQNYIDPDHPQFSLYFLHALGSSFQGGVHAVVYGLNQRVRQHYADMCCAQKVGASNDPQFGLAQPLASN